MLRTVLCLSTLVALHHTALLAQDEPAARKQSAITIGKDTTRITEPLDESGFVDYVAAVDQMSAEGVTRENNFEVVVRRVIGPEEISEQIRTEYYRKLGIEVGSGPFYEDFYASYGEQAQTPADTEAFEAEYDAVMNRPWKAAEFPRAAEWVAAQSKYLDMLVQGASRPRHYTPCIATDFEIDVEDGDSIQGPRLIALLLPSAQSQRELARGLRIRANLYLAEGRYEKAWDDLLAIHRMSRLVSQGVTLIEALVGVALDSIAFDGTRDLLESPDVSDQLLKRMEHDLAGLQPHPPMWRKVDVGERFMGLDCVQWLARNEAATDQPGGLFRFMRMMKLIEALSFFEESSPRLVPVAFQEEAEQTPATTAVNWDVTARRLNVWYDRISEAMREPDLAKRQRRFKKIEEALKALSRKVTDTKSVMAAILKGGTRDALGELFSDILAALLVPALQQASIAEHSAIARDLLLQVAIATESYRRANGKLPDGLAALAPEYLATVPTDPLSGNAFGFRRDGTRVVVYSVGRNGVDDGGNSEDEGRGGQPDDIAIQLGQE